jgi:hypothetical protein
MVYTPEKPPLAESSDQLRARIPGWGADLDPKDRPSVPKLQYQQGRESHLRSFLTLRPDNPITETGVLSEFSGHGLGSRSGRSGPTVSIIYWTRSSSAVRG